MEERLTKKEAQNWLKCMLATYTTREVLAQLADLGFKAFYTCIRNDMRAQRGILETTTCSSCSNPFKQCPLCSEIGIQIFDNHRFKKGQLKGPSWINSDSTKWCTDTWELAKCYMPPTGYRDKPNANSTDFNGIIGAILNCTWMQCYFTDDLSKDPNICTKAREEVNKLRHIPSEKIDDGDMISFFDCLLNLLNDPAHLKSFKPAVDARTYLKQLQQDNLPLSEKTVKSALENIYENRKEDFLGRLIEYYKKTLKMVPVSPFWNGREKSIKDIFVPIQLNRVAIEKNGSRRETEQKVDTYKDMFYKDNTLSDRVSIQGNPGMGKTTFLAKLVLDWCDTVSSKDPGPSSNFGDLETLHNFRFVLHIKLRDSIGQCKVVEMIKTQIIDDIYHNELQKMEAYDLLGSIMERETCLVTLDGLNEWTDRTKENPMPKLYSLCKRCVVLITSRPWKMADKRIRDSEIGTLLEVVGITDPEQLTHNMLCSLTTDHELAFREFMAYVEERNLKHFLTSPWMLTLLVNLWLDKTFLSGSLCEINKVLIKTLFNKGRAKEEFEEPSPFEHSVFGHHTEIGNALAKVAFKYTFGSEKSLVLSKNVLLSSEMLSIEQLEFAIKSGVLNERHCYSTASSKSYVSFLHETVQEFFAASYIANLPEDTITALFSKSHDNVLEISQVIIYLSGLKCDVANKVINHLTEDVLSNVNEGLDRLMADSYDPTTYITFQETVVNTKTKLKSNLNINLNLRGLVLSVLVQDMIVTCYHEAKVSRQKHIRMNMSDFTFHAYLNTNTNDDLLQLLMMNKSNVRTLLLERHALQEKHILTVLQHSKHRIERLKTLGSHRIISELQNMNLKQLSLIGNIDETLFFGLLPSLGNLTFLRIEEFDFHEDIFLPSTIRYLCLLKSRCSAEFVGRLLVHLSQISQLVRLNLGEVYKTENTDLYIAELRSRIKACDMSKLMLYLGKDASQLFKILNASNLGEILFETADVFLSASKHLHTLNKLKYITLAGTYVGSWDCRLPKMLQSITLIYCEFSIEWLCSLLITLSLLDHHAEFWLTDCVMLSGKETRGDDSHTYVSEIRSKMLSTDLSNIMLIVTTGSLELFSILRDSSIGILSLETTECASEILHTLKRLKKLYLWGTYTGRCDLKLPALLQCISLKTCECSSEWLCSLFITLSSLNHPVMCKLWDVQLKSIEVYHGDESHTRVSDMRSELLSHNLSNIEICVQNGSKELFEILRDTRLRILILITTVCASLPSEIIHTLSSLTQLYLTGTYTGRCHLKLPGLLQCIRMQTCECSSEWLCSLFITLSSLDHPVRCELWDVQLKSIEVYHGDESHTRVSDMRYELLSHNLSNIEICVQNGSKELFEILRDTRLGILILRTTGCASLPSEIIHTLSSLTQLYLTGTYTGRCHLKLPALLQCIRMQTCECSSEWLCSLFITLSSLDHPVRCELWDVRLKSIEVYHGDESHTSVSDMRCELLSHDLFNINICVQNGSKELFEILRDTRLRILILRTTGCASLSSEILHTLSSLTKLYLTGTYTGRFDLKLPALLQCISVQKFECSSEWLCSLFIALSSLDHPVRCKLWDVQLKSIEVYHGDESHTSVSDMRYELLSHNLSNIEICVQNGSKELFEILRDTSIGILELRTTDCASLASGILHTLSRLTKLYLWGTYTGRCDLKMPALLQCISMQKGEFSSEWLCSLLIALSSLDHPVKCELVDVVLHSSEETIGCESHLNVLDLRSEMLHDMSYIEILVQIGSKELFEIFRDTGIGILYLRTAECTSLASEIIHTLNKLRKLYLWGTYTGQCDLKLPASLQCISLQNNKLSYEWLRSLFIKLFALYHTVKCELWDVVLLSSEGNRDDESHAHVSDLRSEILFYDVFNIKIQVRNVSEELLKILSDTSLVPLDNRTTDCIPLVRQRPKVHRSCCAAS